MKKIFKNIVTYVVCVSLVITGGPSPFMAAQKAMAQSGPLQQNPKTMSIGQAPDEKQLRDDLMLAHWLRVNDESPALAEFALGQPLVTSNEPLWKIDPNSSSLDEDPFFLRSQEWSPLTSQEQSDLQSCDSLCTLKSSDGTLLIASRQASKSLKLKQGFTAVLETDVWIFFAADSDDIFNSKTNTKDPSQGLFFINKKDVSSFVEKEQPVPVFHLPLVGRGWLSHQIAAREIPVYDHIALKAQDGFTLEIDKNDVLAMEQLSRKNLTILQMVSLVTQGLDHRGLALPAPRTTMVFGLIASGIIPKSSSVGALSNDNFKKLISEVLIAKAHAGERDNNGTTIQDQILRQAQARIAQVESSSPEENALPRRSGWRRWLTPTILYGGTGAAAVGASQSVDWTQLITDDMPQRILTVASIFGVVAVTSLTMRYTIHRDFFEKKYPKAEKESLLQKISREHKAFMDEFVYGLRFSAGVTTQAILRSIDYLKDRVFPSNKLVHEAWMSTLGFYIQASTKLPIDYRCFYLGAIVFGMSDALMVAVDLLIFTPYVVKTFGLKAIEGGAFAAFASATVLSNFLSYLQTGAISYSIDVRMINMDRAKKEAKRILSSQGVDVEDPKNQHKVVTLQEEILSKIATSVGLPGKDAFLYDTITVMEKMIGVSGYSAHSMSPTDLEKVNKSVYVLKNRHWGLIQPALTNAIAHAEELYRQNPTEVGRQTIEMLKWVVSHKNYLSSSSVKGVVQNTSFLVSPFTDTMDTVINAAIQEQSKIKGATIQNPLPYWDQISIALKAIFKFSTHEQISQVRDIRKVLYLMSTTGSYKDAVEFLPSSWVQKAGSVEVAQLAAEYFHREFMALFEKKKHLSSPPRDMTEQFEKKAQAMVRDMMVDEPALQDTFMYESRVRAIVAQLYEQDQARIKFLTYKPEKMSRYEQMQWSEAFDVAQRHWDQNSEALLSEMWKSSAEIYKQRYKANDDSFNQQDWILQNSRKLSVLRAMGRNVGLYISDIQDSKVVKDVLIKSVSQMEGDIHAPEVQNYLQKVSAEERELFESRRLYEHFVSNYFEQTVTNDKFDAYSGEFPGRFQKIRSRLDGKKWGAPILSLVKGFEIAFRSDASSYSPGFVAKINRSVPLLPDFYHNFVRTLRSAPYSLTVGYLVSWYIWQVHIPYPMLVFGLTFGFIHPSMVEMNNRFMRSYNIKPMDDVPSKLTYSYVHSRLTNPMAMFELAYASTIVALFSTQNLLMGAGAAVGLVAGKYLYSKNKKSQEEKERLSQIERDKDQNLHLRARRCVDLFAVP